MQDSRDDASEFSTFAPERKLNRVNKDLVERLTEFVEKSLASKLDGIERLIEKNNRNLAQASRDFKKIEDVVTSYQKSNKSQCLSDEIRLLFALARSERLDLVGKVANIDQANKAVRRTPLPSRSRSPIVNQYNHQPVSFSTAKKSKPQGAVTAQTARVIFLLNQG